MATKIFSSRADESGLAFADALARKEYGLSFGQYCGTILIDAITASGKMPALDQPAPSNAKQQAATLLKGFTARVRDPEIGRLSDEGIRELIAGRYA